MTTDKNKLLKVRKTFLDSLNDPLVETQLLSDMLNELQSSHPSIIDVYVGDDNYEPVDCRSLHWNEQYFSRQKKLAERNFALERLDHLIQVRDCFRKEGRKGFVSTAQGASARPLQESKNDYRPSNNLRKFVEEGDLQTMQTALIVELEDHSIDARSLLSALAWAKERVPNLCEPYEEKAFARGIEKDRIRWTPDYYSKQSVYLDTNFAEERFLHLVEVREYLREQEARAPGKSAGNPQPAVSSRPVAKTNATAASVDQEQPHPSTSAWSNPRRLSPTFIAALLIGGALATVVILILALRR